MLSRREWLWLGAALLAGNLLFAWMAVGEVRTGHGDVVKLRPDKNLPERLFVAKPERVHDGDTPIFPQGSCRLLGIDAPELVQPLGAEAKRALIAILPADRAVLVMVFGNDKYGRMLCLILGSDGYLVNLAMVESGFALVYLADGSLIRDGLIEAEARARADRRGVWGLKQFEPPWEWRKRIKVK